MELSQSFLISKQSNEKLQVRNGETVIGRGPFLKVKDKRVSRSHATLSFNDGCLKIKPTHTNPTFLLIGSESKYKVLEKDIWKELHDGDTISLLPDDLIFTIEIAKVTNAPTSASAPNSDELVQGAPEPLVADLVNKTEEDLVKPVAAKSVDCQNQSPCKEEAIEDIMVDASKIVRTSTFESSIEVMDDSAWSKISSNDRKTEDVKPKNDPSPADETDLKATLPDTTQTEPSQITVSKGPKSTKRILPSWMTSPGKGPAGKGASKGAEKKKKSTNDDPVDDAKLKATKKSSVAAQNKKEESQATSGSKKRSSSIEEEEISTQKKAKIDKIMHSVDAKKAKTNDSKVSNDNETRDDFEEGITKDSSLAENSCQVGIKLSMAGSKKEDKSEKDHSEVSKNKLEKEHDSRNTAGPAATSHNASNDAKRTKKLPKCPYGNSCYRKNPVHFQEYSHDSGEDDDDDDKNDDDLPECPYGTSCYRQNPQHKREYKHTKTPEAQQNTKRKSTRTRKNPRKKSAIAGDSDDDGEVNDYDYDDSFIDDDFEESDVSSYDDEEDDSDYTPDGMEEELNELKG